MTGEKEAVNPVTVVTASNNASPPIDFCIDIYLVYFIVFAIVGRCDSISTEKLGCRRKAVSMQKAAGFF